MSKTHLKYRSLNSTVEPTDLSIAISEEIDLGEIQEGESTSADIEVENTGNVDVSNLEVSSEDYSISADSMSLSAGSTETVSVEFSDITSESGQITVTAGSDSILRQKQYLFLLQLLFRIMRRKQTNLKIE